MSFSCLRSNISDRWQGSCTTNSAKAVGRFGLPEVPVMPKHLAYIIVIATFCLLTIPFLAAAQPRTGRQVRPDRALVKR